MFRLTKKKFFGYYFLLFSRYFSQFFIIFFPRFINFFYYFLVLYTKQDTQHLELKIDEAFRGSYTHL